MRLATTSGEGAESGRLKARNGVSISAAVSWAPTATPRGGTPAPWRFTTMPPTAYDRLAPRQGATAPISAAPAPTAPPAGHARGVTPRTPTPGPARVGLVTRPPAA